LLFACLKCLGDGPYIQEATSYAKIEGLIEREASLQALQQEVNDWKIYQARFLRTLHNTSTEEGSAMINVTLLTTNYNMTITPTSTVWDIKLFLEKVTSTPAKSFRLLFAGTELKVLSPTRQLNTLIDMGITGGVSMAALIGMNAFAGQSNVRGLSCGLDGNPIGADLIPDGGLQGYGVAVLQLYPFDFEPPKSALQAMGLALTLWVSNVPSLVEFQRVLSQPNMKQLWVISTSSNCIPSQYIQAMVDFNQQGGSLYLWGDNDPYNDAVNPVIAKTVPGILLAENYYACKQVSHRPAGNNGPGFSDHYIFTGVINLFEGNTIARFKGHNPKIKYIMNSSEGQPALGIVEAEAGCGRIAIDCGFTRLFCSWDDAGTARFVKNIAGWLCALDDDAPY